MIPWLLFVLAIVFYLWTGWLSYMLHVPVVYGLLVDGGPVDRGEIDSRGCIVPANPKRWTIQIGYRLPSLEEWGRGAERLHEVDELEATLESVTGVTQMGSTQHEM